MKRKTDISQIRFKYKKKPFDIKNSDSNPFKQFSVGQFLRKCDFFLADGPVGPKICRKDFGKKIFDRDIFLENDFSARYQENKLIKRSHLNKKIMPYNKKNTPFLIK